MEHRILDKMIKLKNPNILNRAWLDGIHSTCTYSVLISFLIQLSMHYTGPSTPLTIGQFVRMVERVRMHVSAEYVWICTTVTQLIMPNTINDVNNQKFEKTI